MSSLCIDEAGGGLLLLLSYRLRIDMSVDCDGHALQENGAHSKEIHNSFDSEARASTVLIHVRLAMPTECA